MQRTPTSGLTRATQELTKQQQKSKSKLLKLELAPDLHITSRIYTTLNRSPIAAKIEKQREKYLR